VSSYTNQFEVRLQLDLEKSKPNSFAIFEVSVIKSQEKLLSSENFAGLLLNSSDEEKGKNSSSREHQKGNKQQLITNPSFRMRMSTMVTTYGN
jgi:hypothetical protein